jgi:predicted dehydrogenase
MRDRLKILFAGLGSIGQRHVRNLRALLGDNVDILAYRACRQSPALNSDMSVCGPAPETVYNIRCFENLEVALEEKPDALFVTNPNTLHLSVALAAAQAGCHLFIEKPLSHSLEHTDELIEIVERNKLVALVGYQFRFHPGVRLLKSIITDGRLGTLLAAHIVNAEYLPDWHPYEDYRDSHAARRELGGGCLNIQTHEIDYALWLFGTPKRVYAVGGHLSDLEVTVEDSVSMLLHCGFSHKPLPVHIHLDYLQRPPQRICEVVGDAGKVRYDYYENSVEIYQTDPTMVEVKRFEDFDRNQMFLDELRHFLACLRGEEKPLIDLREAQRSMRISLDAARSLHSGCAVDCQLD